MTIAITIEVPDTLGHQLAQLHDRLPEVLEHGIRDIVAEAANTAYDEQTIITVLTSQPTLEQLLALHPSDALQQHVQELQERSSTGALTNQKRGEFEQALLLEHLVHLTKANAYQRLAHPE